jgi:retron-type reverse transcriptase
MISYEISIGFTVLTVVICSGSFSLSTIVLAQQKVWFMLPLFPIFIIFYVSMLAETNRHPFDLPEAEAELYERTCSFLGKNRCVFFLIKWMYERKIIRYLWEKYHHKFDEVNVWQKFLNLVLRGVIYQRSSDFFEIARFKVERSLLIQASKIPSFYQRWCRMPSSGDLYRPSRYQYEQSLARRSFTTVERSLRETGKNEPHPQIVDTITALAVKNEHVVKTELKGKTQKKAVAPKKEQLEFVQALYNTFDKSSGKFKNLHKVAFDEKTLFMAYNETSKKKGSITSGGGEQQSPDGVSHEVFKIIAERLKLSQYKIGASRQILIPKKNDEERPLTIMSPWDKVVAYSIYMTLLYVYGGNNIVSDKDDRPNIDLKPIFLSSNHGFRTNRSCHTALNELQTWSLCSRFVKLGIRKFFDKVNEEILLNILRENIEDKHLLSLIQQMLNAEILINELGDGAMKGAGIGIPQGNPLSPLLANIYLHKLDEFVKTKMQKSWNKSDLQKYGSAMSKECCRFAYVKVNELKNAKTQKQKNKLKRELKHPEVKDAQVVEIKRQLLTDKFQLKETHQAYRRVYYVRYADDFIFGIRGPKSLAAQVKEECSFFIKNDLHLELKFANLYNSKTDRVKYLGFEVRVPSAKETGVSKLKENIAFSKLRNRIKQRKKILEDKWGNLLDRALRNKMSLQVNEILGGISKKILLDKAVNQVTRKTLLTMIAKATEEMLLENEKESKTTLDKDKINFAKANTLYLTNQEHIKRWRSDILSYLKDNWIHRDELSEVIGGNKIIEDHSNLLKSLSAASNTETVALVKVRQTQKLKKESATAHTIKRTTRGIKQGLRPKLFIPQNAILERMRQWGMIDQKINKPIACNALLKYHDIQFIEHFKSKARGLLEYYRPAFNYHWIKKQVNYHMRWSLLFTIARKHKKNLTDIVKLFGKNANMYIQNKKGELELIAGFLTPSEINSYTSGFTFLRDPIEDYVSLKRPLIKFSIPRALYKECQVKNCPETVIDMHHVQSIYRRIQKNLASTSVENGSKRIINSKVVESALGRKQIPLCKTHHAAINRNELSLDDFKGDQEPIRFLNSSKIRIR